MNDRFKFRAKRCDNGEFVFGYLNFIYVDKPEKARIYCQDDTRSYDVITKTLEQCTGLKDKNGRLIYEGDIVCWTRAQTDGDVDSICPIVFDNDMCSFGPLLNGHSLWMPHQTDLRMEVVGNIHENPEMLEEK